MTDVLPQIVPERVLEASPVHLAKGGSRRLFNVS